MRRDRRRIVGSHWPQRKRVREHAPAGTRRYRRRGRARDRREVGM